VRVRNSVRSVAPVAVADPHRDLVDALVGRLEVMASVLDAQILHVHERWLAERTMPRVTLALRIAAGPRRAAVDRLAVR
jgi:hypothetical protein